MIRNNKRIRRIFLAVIIFLLASCAGRADVIVDYEGKSLYEVRQDFDTNIVNIQQDKSSLSVPQNSNFNIVRYPSPAGELSAYITNDPGDGGRHPVIIWVRGGFDNTISVNMLSDDTIKEYYEAGIIVMYPGLRGGNQNPGTYEFLFGEVDDIICAADYLSKLDYINPDKIYLGGHSTDGTLVLLATETTDLFRASFSLAPMDNLQNYEPKRVIFDTANQKEYDLRSPVLWLDDIRTPIFVFTGTKDGNYKNLKSLKSHSNNSSIFFYAIKNGNHNNVLNPIAKLIAQKIKEDNGEMSDISFNEQQVNAL